MNGQDWRILKDSPDGFRTESKNIALQGLHVVRTGSARGPHGVCTWSARSLHVVRMESKSRVPS